MAETTTGTVDRSVVNAEIYKTFKLMVEERKVYPDAYGRKIPGIPQPLTVLVYQDKSDLRKLFSSNSEYANYLFKEVFAFEKSGMKNFNDNNKALQVYNAMGGYYPPKIGSESMPTYFERLKKQNMSGNIDKAKEEANKLISSAENRLKEAFY
jgi:hypothetical protein